MIERTLGFVATVRVAAGAGRQPAGLPQDVIMPGGRVIRIFAGNPND
jgi:hypothetical protein